MKHSTMDRRWLAAIVLGGLVMSPLTSLLHAADPETKQAPLFGGPASRPATAPSARSGDDIKADLKALGEELSTIMSPGPDSPDPLTNAKQRELAAPKAIPAFKKYLVLVNELASVDPMIKAQASGLQNRLLSILTTFGDADAEKELTKQSAGEGPAATEAKGALLVAKWCRSSTDAAAQTKLAAEAESLMKANPTDDSVAMILMQMSQQGASTPELKKGLQKALVENAKGPRAQMVIEQLQSELKLAEIEGKPLAISGMLVDGKPFNTADWKGKVVFVDFWATWCGPCLAELPRVKKVYADYHGKGLEILGVSNDYSAAALTKFMDENKDMPWPQLLDATAAGKHEWNPITTGFGIQGIPTMFLIDKKGIVRTVSARENFEELIPKMLDEK